MHVSVHIDEVVRATNDQDGYQSATCICCKANGLLTVKHGLAYSK